MYVEMIVKNDNNLDLDLDISRDFHGCLMCQDFMDPAHLISPTTAVSQTEAKAEGILLPRQTDLDKIHTNHKSSSSKVCVMSTCTMS